jgi:tyrosine-protein kinase Etk/Wzc
VHRIFDLPNERGLATLLRDETLPLGAALYETPMPGLLVLPSGSRDTLALASGSPVDLLGSPAMQRRLDELAASADVVLVDGPAVLSVADASLLGSLCRAVVLVVGAGRTRSALVAKARAALDQAGANVLGVVLNRASSRPTSYQRYYAQAEAADRRAGRRRSWRFWTAWPRSGAAGAARGGTPPERSGAPAAAGVTVERMPA